MSRIGKKPITLPEKTTATRAGDVLTVTGPGGTISRTFKSDITITIADGVITLEPKKKTLDTNALWGTYASHIDNMVTGVNTPFKEVLVIEGIGYKSEVKGNSIVFGLGFSHPVTMEIPTGLKVTSDKNVITISGIDKELVGQFTANIRALKKPEPYKGKGFHYDDEVIRRKAGKKTA